MLIVYKNKLNHFEVCNCNSIFAPRNGVQHTHFHCFDNIIRPMLKQLRLALLMIMALTAALPLAAQVRHVTTVNPTTKQSYTEVYEFDYVDIQPQFPGGERGLINFIN